MPLGESSFDIEHRSRPSFVVRDDMGHIICSVRIDLELGYVDIESCEGGGSCPYQIEIGDTLKDKAEMVDFARRTLSAIGAACLSAAEWTESHHPSKDIV